MLILSIYLFIYLFVRIFEFNVLELLVIITNYYLLIILILITNVFFFYNFILINKEHSYHGSPQKWKRRYEDIESVISKTLKQARNAVRREQRAKQACQSLLEILEQQNLINAELQAKLEAFNGSNEEQVFFESLFIAVCL